MALSKATQIRLVVALASKTAAADLQAAVTARAALSVKSQKVLAVALTSQLNSKAKAKSAVDEIVAAIVSGADLSVGAKRRILEMMAGATAGNDLINFIQTNPQASPTKL